LNNIKSSYSAKYPFSLEMSGGIRECESLEEAIEIMELYAI
jgi:hypothetical protein